MSLPLLIDPNVPFRTYQEKFCSLISTLAVCWLRRGTPKISPIRSRLVSVAKGNSDWAMFRNCRPSSSASSLARISPKARALPPGASWRMPVAESAARIIEKAHFAR